MGRSSTVERAERASVEYGFLYVLLLESDGRFRSVLLQKDYMMDEYLK